MQVATGLALPNDIHISIATSSPELATGSSYCECSTASTKSKAS